MAQLAEAYIHLRPYSVSEKEARKLGRYLESVAVRQARNIFQQRVVVDVELEEGSLRAWATVSGGILLAIYEGVANYKSFKESVPEIVQDARAFTELVYPAFVKKADASNDQIYRVERRTKTPGRMYRLAKHLERLEGSHLSTRDMKQELYRARMELERIEADLAPEEKKKLDEALTLPHLPPPAKWPEAPQPEMPKAALPQDYVQPSLFNAQLGFTLPIRREASAEPERKLIYQHRTIVEPKARRPRSAKPPVRKVVIASLDNGYRISGTAVVTRRPFPEK